MAFFNPHKVDFNYDTRMIDAVGAVGKSLWDIYKTNVEKNQNQAKLDETNRANLATEGLYDARNQETARHNLAGEAETARKNAFDQDLSLKNFYSTDALRRAQINNLYADNARQNTQLQWNISQARDKAQAEQEKQAGIDMAWYNAGQQGGQFKDQAPNLSDAEKINLGRQYRLQTEAQGGINKVQEPILKQQEAQRKEEQAAKTNDFLFNQMGGQIPPGMTDPKEQAAYKAAYVSPEAIKARTAGKGGYLTRLPAGQATRLENAKTLLSQYGDYANSLVGKKGDVTGPLDVITAPTARFFGLSDADIADLYAQRDAIAENERAFTKGGGYRTAEEAKKALDPVHLRWSTTKANVNANLQKWLKVYDETINVLQKQKDYAGVAEIRQERDDFIKTLPIEFQLKNSQQQNREATQLFMQKMGMPTDTASINFAPQPSGGYAPQNLYDEMSTYDENGIRYVGDDGFNSW